MDNNKSESSSFPKIGEEIRVVSWGGRKRTPSHATKLLIERGLAFPEQISNESKGISKKSKEIVMEPFAQAKRFTMSQPLAAAILGQEKIRGQENQEMPDLADIDCDNLGFSKRTESVVNISFINSTVEDEHEENRDQEGDQFPDDNLNKRGLHKSLRRRFAVRRRKNQIKCETRKACLTLEEKRKTLGSNYLERFEEQRQRLDHSRLRWERNYFKWLAKFLLHFGPEPIRRRISRHLQCRLGWSGGALLSLHKDLVLLNLFMTCVMLTIVVLPSIIIGTQRDQRVGWSSNTTAGNGSLIAERPTHPQSSHIPFLRAPPGVSREDLNTNETETDECVTSSIAYNDPRIHQCSQYYDEFMDGFSSSRNNKTFAILFDVLQGTGFVEASPIFSAYYPAIAHEQNYPVALLYIIACVICLIVTLIYIVRRSGTYLRKKCSVDGKDRTEVSALVFTGWDWSISEPLSVTAQQKSIVKSLQVTLEHISKQNTPKVISLRAKMCQKLVRTSTNYCVLVLTAAAWIMVYEATKFQQNMKNKFLNYTLAGTYTDWIPEPFENRVFPGGPTETTPGIPGMSGTSGPPGHFPARWLPGKSSTPVQPGVVTPGVVTPGPIANYTTQEPPWIFTTPGSHLSQESLDAIFALLILVQCLVTGSVYMLSKIFPPIMKFIGKIENYSEDTSMKLLTARLVVLQFSSVGVIVYSQLNNTDMDRCPKWQPCWEAELGQQVFALLMFQPIVWFCSTVVEMLIYLPMRLCPVKSIRNWVMHELDVPSHVLQLLGLQSLSWIGLTIAPLLPLATLILLGLYGILLLIQVGLFCKPAPNTQAPAATKYMFVIGSGVSYVCAMTCTTLMVLSLSPSYGCSPFRGLENIMECPLYYICQLDGENHIFRDVLLALGTTATLLPIAAILAAILAYKIFRVFCINWQVVALRRRLARMAEDKNKLLGRCHHLRVRQEEVQRLAQLRQQCCTKQHCLQTPKADM